MKRLLLLFCIGLFSLLLSIGCSEEFRTPVEPAVIYDTTFDTLLLPQDTVFDTTFVGPDTVIDTIVIPPDTVVVYDTITVVDTLMDTLLIVDSLYDTTLIVDTLIDTVLVPIDGVVFKNCRFWKLKDGQMSVQIQLENPAGEYLVGMERIRLTRDIPNALEIIVDFGNNQVFQKSVHGQKHFVDWSGPVWLPEDAMVTISLDEPWFAGKITGEQCREYFKGFWWWGIRPPQSD